MQSLFLDATNCTPSFVFKEEESVILIKGDSKIDEDQSYYTSITEFIKILESKKPLQLKCVIELSSICRKSKRGVLFFLLALKDLQSNCNTQLSVDWIYDAENSLVKSIGENLEYMVRTKINFVEKEQLKVASASPLELAY